MTQTDSRAELTAIVAELVEVDPASVTPDKSFADDLKADSLCMVDIAVRVEEDLGVKIADEELGGIRTVADLLSYVEARR